MALKLGPLENGSLMRSKLVALEEILAAMPGALVAYSGGADSAFLAAAAHRFLPGKSRAVLADSPSLPRSELAEAQELARSQGWDLEVVRTDELSDERYASNPTDRCYYCKSALFDRLEPLSASSGWPVLLGTNVDDLGDWRPGQRAVDQRGGRHPMVEARLTKAEIRALSRDWGLPTHDKPAAACLASRFAYGVRVTSEGLSRVEDSEAWLASRGYAVVRVRDLGGDRAKIEVGQGEVSRLSSEGVEVIRHLRTLGFRDVAIDERGYRQGSLNEGVVSLGLPKKSAVR